MTRKKFVLKKLVRSKIPELTGKEIEAVFLRLKRNKYLYQLKHKLIEESKEVLRTKNKAELIEEMGDVFEVFHLILEENRISLNDILKVLENKQMERGKIENLFLHSLVLPEDHMLVKKYENAGYKPVVEVDI